MVNLAEGIGDVDNSVLKSAKSFQDGKIGINEFRDSALNATTATAKFGAVLKSIGANLVIMLAISAAIKGITWVADKLITTPEELSEVAKESISEYNSLQQEVSALDSELTSVRERIKEIKSQGSLSFVEQEELSRLERTNEELEREYEIKKKLAESSNTQAREDANNYFNQDRAMYGTDYGVRDTIWGKQVYTTEYGSGDQIDFATDKVLLYSKTLDDVKSKEQELLNLDQNSKEYESLNKEIELLRSQATSLNTEITSLFNEFTTNDDVLDPEMDAETIQRLSDFYNLLEDILNMGSGEDTTASFNEIWDSKEFESSRKELEKLARAGELTPETLKSVKNYDKLLDATDKSVEELIGHIKSLNESGSSTGSPFEATSISNTISILDAMADKWKAVNTLYNEFQENGVGKFSNEAMNEVVESFKEIEGVDVDSFLSVLSDSSSTVEEVQDAFDELATEYIFASNCLEGLTDATADQVVKELEAKGIANASAIVYDYLAAQKQYAAETSRDLANASIYEVAQLINGGNVSEDVAKKIAGYVLQKELANGVSLSTDGDIENIKTLMKACGEGITAIISFQNAKSGLMETMEAGLPKNLNPIDPIGNLELIDASAKAAKEYQELSEKAYEEVRTALANVSSNMKANTVSAPGTSSGSGDSSKSSKDQEKYYDWTEQALERIAAENDKIREQVDDTNLSYDERLSLQKRLLESNQDELEIMKTVNQRKVEGWEQAKNDILSTFGEEEGNDYISKILFGNIDKNEWLDKIKDEAHKKLIDTAITANEELEESNEWLADKEKENAEDVQKAFEMQKNEIKALVDEVQTSIDSIQSSISIRETSGTEIITEADYRSLISHSKEQISLYEEQLDILEDQLDTLDEGSAEWYNVKSQIASCEASINDCVEAQAEWNEEIKKLPIRRVERYLELLENIKTDITNFQAEQDVLGINATKEQYQELVSITEEQIKKLLEKHKELEKNLSTYTYGTDAFNECSNSIQDVENNISDLIQEMREYNNQILQIPINKIEELNEQLSNVNSALAEIGEDYSTTVNTVVDSIDHQIESIEDLKTAEEEAAQVKIDALQEQLDLLESQNEERKIQLALEQAEYNLERAKNQKTNQVVRNGEIVYEADQDDLRDAQQNLADAQYDKLTHDIETQIEQIEENRDAMIENYDAEIDRLEKISEKWSEIEHNIEDAKNAVIADDILGTGWKDKVLSGNDQDIYDKFVSEYETNLNQQDSYTKLIEQNEKISALMQQYIDAYNDGSITYEEAVKQFTAVQNAAKDGLTSEEYLNALLKISGDKDVDSALKNVQTEVSGAYSDFKSYFDAVNKNSEIIASYTSTWEEIRDAVVEQLETLKKLAEEEAKKVAEAKSSSSGRKHSSGGGSSTKWDSRDENNGPGREINDRAAGITSSSSSSSSSSSPSGPASDPDLKARKRKSGIETGIVGKDTSNSNAETVRILALDKLKSDEEPAILHKGEVVLNEVQMKNIVDNFRTALIHPINLPQVTIPNIARQQPNITIEMKDFNFNEVDNVRDFCDEMQRNFDPIMTQYFSKK